MSEIRLENEETPVLQGFASVARPGFEPGQTEPKSVVLPLHYRAPCAWGVIYRMTLMAGKVQSPTGW